MVLTARNYRREDLATELVPGVVPGSVALLLAELPESRSASEN
jgi:hypothetical protein